MGVRGRTAILVTLDEDVSELEELARSAGLTISYEMIQRRRPHPATFIGKGKVDDVAHVISQSPVDIVLVNGDLTPKQQFTLERALDMEVVDRIRLVLDIFDENANSRQARLQVERATLRYEMPLIKEWVHNARANEHPGFLSGGEYSTGVYYDYIRRRIVRIDRELASIGDAQDRRRERRRSSGVPIVGIAGYTNAGKSSLFNVLTDEEATEEDRMFSTLATTTRRLRTKRRVLVIDTIGFIRDLPHYMIEAFRTTLDDIMTADLVLLVVDASEPVERIQEKVDTSMAILDDTDRPARVMVVANKSDRTGAIEEVINLLFHCGEEVLPVSARTGEGVERLLESISRELMPPISIRIVLPQCDATEGLISWLYANSHLDSIERSESVTIVANVMERDVPHVLDVVESCGGIMSPVEI